MTKLKTGNLILIKNQEFLIILYAYKDILYELGKFNYQLKKNIIAEIEEVKIFQSMVIIELKRTQILFNTIQ